MATEPNPQQATAPPGTEKTIRLVRPSIVVLCGPAACGKSTFAERHFRPTQIISSDWARERVCDDPREQRYQSQVFALVHFLIEQRLSLNRLCVVDSTALTTQARRDLLDLARKYQVPCIALLLEVPLEKCIERDQARERTVGRPVIERQHQSFQQAKTAIRQEGFEQVVELRDEELDKVRIEIIFRPVARPATGPSVSRWTEAPRRPAPGRGEAGQGGLPARPGGPAQAGSRPQPPARSEGIESAAAHPTGSARVSAKPDSKLPTPGAAQATTAVPGAASQVAPAATSKPDVPGPAAEPASPPASQGAGRTPFASENPSGGPPEQGKT